MNRDHHCTRNNRGAHGQGTHSCYTLCRCRCWDCCVARSDYERDRHRRNNRGDTLTVDAEPVRQHVYELGRQGVGQRTITKKAGVSRSGLQKLLGQGQFAPTRKVRRATADAILSVSAADRADGSFVPAGPTWRRINEMLDAGWTRRGIARHVHGPQARSLQLSHRRVLVRNAKTVAVLHRKWKAGLVPTAVSRKGQRPERTADVA